MTTWIRTKTYADTGDRELGWWAADFGQHTINIGNRHRQYPDGNTWLLSCAPWFDAFPLKAKNFEDATSEAVAVLQGKFHDLIDAIEGLRVQKPCEATLNVHPLLKDLHQASGHSEHCCGSGSCRQNGKKCHAYVSCGVFHPFKEGEEPDRLCPGPCTHCLAWEGYGCETTEDVLRLKAAIERQREQHKGVAQ